PMVSEFCTDCVDEASARQRAASFAPPVSCDWPNGRPEFPIPSDLECRSKHRDVLLVNPFRNELFSYRLYFDRMLNRHILQNRIMSSDERRAAETVVDVHQALMSANFGGSVSEGDVTSSQSAGVQNDMSCPDGTALDHVLNPELREWMFAELENQYSRVMAAFRNRSAGVSTSTGISASVGGVSLTVGWSRAEGNSQPPVFEAGFVFDFSEVVRESSIFRDTIVFRVDRARFIRGVFSLDASFDEGLSRAAGRPVTQLLTGQTVIDNPCVQEKLKEYADNNPVLEFREGGAGGPLFDFQDITQDNGGELCTKRLCATVCVDGRCACQFEVVVLTFCDT
ncbi:MAG: hypothetical protein ACNS61_04225, partial [Candidatus Wenzhouxiangella sp. M2_3B_020]